MLASRVLMIRPQSFSVNPETLSSNAFQSRSTAPSDTSDRAAQEFDDFVKKLRAFGIDVMVVEGQGLSPDEVFPNNWISFFEDQMVIYPMQSLSRRKEKRRDILTDLSMRWQKKEIIDLSYLEEMNLFLEGTGSLILDRDARVAFASLSPRTHREALRIFSEAFKYEIHEFCAVADCTPVYHTNVIMSVGERTALMVFDAIPEPAEREKLSSHLKALGKNIIPLTLEQLYSFAGNALQLKNSNGQSAWVMSQRAYQSLSDAQKSQLLTDSEVIYSDLCTIETFGGGSARCMICEIF